MRSLSASGKCVLASAAALATLTFVMTAHAGVTVLYAFKGRSDGAYPDSRLIEDSAGNLYGTTGDDADNGTAFKLTPDGTKTKLHTFTGKGGDGFLPLGGLIEDEAGNLYGTTQYGGTGGTYGDGTVFEIAPDGTETVVYSFCSQGDCIDGANPSAGLLSDKARNLYGTTVYGGGTGCDDGSGCGTVFELAPDGTETVLHAFTGGRDGAAPLASLLRDKTGNFYGTTSVGGGGDCKVGAFESGCGTVFELAVDGTETVLYAFAGGSDGSYPPQAGLIQDKAGNLYGTTAQGGGGGCSPYNGCGTVFKLALDGTETVLYAFNGGSDGAVPLAGLIQDKAGNLYGTTAGGGGTGGHSACESNPRGCGTVFELAPDGAETVLFAFRHHTRDGVNPHAALIKGEDGELYGTASDGGSEADCNGFGCGTVFRLKK
jgi:uncharacterized repeat protein (TIGR03803 family)